MSDPTERFSSRVDCYVRYRPGYPPALIEAMARECGLAPGMKVVDLGSGTGILSALLLERGCEVFGVEPNAAMRDAGERLLAGHALFHSVAGRAEDTTLPDASMDMAVAGQAFHWFRPADTRAEVQRVVKPAGCVVLIWNSRMTTGSAFLEAYEELLRRYGTDYESVNHERIDAGALHAFFGAGGYQELQFPNRQLLDYAGLEGRLLSSSYAPESGHPNHQPMLDELARIFRANAAGGIVSVEYVAKMYYGRLAIVGSR